MKKSNIRLRKRSLFYTTAVFLLGLVFFFNQTVIKADLTPHLLTPGTPLIQNWGNIAMITADNDWSGVASIIGYRGDGLAATGADPQGVIADGSATPINVEANETNPDTFPNGGNAEFHITNPVVAFQGSGTADAPHIVATLNTLGCALPTNVVNVAYTLRDIDTVSTAVQPVALQYRIGTSGNYTNVTAAFIGNANVGSDTAVTSSLPLSTRNQATIQVRWITVDATGADAFIGIDDINISCATLAAANASVGGQVKTASGNAIGGAAVTISGGGLTEPVTAITNPFGYYQFEEIQVGSTYVLSVSSKRYTFANPTRVVTVEENVFDQDFVSNEP